MRLIEVTAMRSLSRDARHERRVQVIPLHKTSCTYANIAKQATLSRIGVLDIRRRHTEAGAVAPRDAPIERKTRDGRLLPAAQDALMRKLMTDKPPTGCRCRRRFGGGCW